MPALPRPSPLELSRAHNINKMNNDEWEKGHFLCSLGSALAVFNYLLWQWFRDSIQWAHWHFLSKVNLFMTSVLGLQSQILKEILSLHSLPLKIFQWKEYNSHIKQLSQPFSGFFAQSIKKHWWSTSYVSGTVLHAEHSGEDKTKKAWNFQALIKNSHKHH